MTGHTYRGPEGVLHYMSDIDEQFESWQLEAEEMRDVGEEWLLAFGRVHLRGRASGIEMDVPFAWLIRFREERALDLQIFSSHEEAEAAAKDLE